MDFKWISAGELEKDQYVTILGFRPQQKKIVVPTGDVITVTEEDKSPWIKGIPFKILKVALPLVMLENIANLPNVPPVLFHDTRLVEFLEVDKEYADVYIRTLFPQQALSQPSLEQLLAEGLRELEEGDEDDQQEFPFFTEAQKGDEPEKPKDEKKDKKDDDDEDGPPPLVPA